jgi:osmotically-inducible protein OsmY
MKTRPVVSLLLALMLATALAGCMTPEEQTQPPSDRQITRDITNRLLEDPVTARQSFGVNVVDGVVTLDGAVPDENVRLRAIAVARGARGVTDVVDKLYRW